MLCLHQVKTLYKHKDQDCIAGPAVAVLWSPSCRISEVGLYKNPHEARSLDFGPQSASLPKLYIPLGLHKALVQNDDTRGF